MDNLTKPMEGVVEDDDDDSSSATASSRPASAKPEEETAEGKLPFPDTPVINTR